MKSLRLSLIFAFALSCILWSCTNKTGIPPMIHPDSSEWPNLFQADLSDAIYPDSVWTYAKGEFTASEDQFSCITARNCKQISTSTGLTMGLECTMQVLVGGMWWIR
jgi:hypothetical protein